MRIRRVSHQYDNNTYYLNGRSGAVADGEERTARVGEKVVSLIVDDDEGREVADLDLPDGLHPELGVLDRLDPGDAVLGQPRRRPADRAEVEAAVCLAGLGHGGGAVPLGQHDQ